MADIISRLKLESGEFDSKIKRAGQELMAYSEHCRKTGLEMGYANRDAKEFAKALGNMQTTSATARGKISELSDAFVNLRVMYKNMTDEEKNNQFGKNLAASLDKLKIRIQDAKKDLSDVTAELNGKKGGGLFGGGKLDGMLQVFGGNLMTKGAGMLAGLASEMGDMVKQGVELAKQGEGIRIAFERLGRGDILDGLRQATHGTVTDIELMKAAVKFNDFKLPLDELGTMLAFAQQKAKDTGQSVDYMVDSIVTGLGRKSLMILDNLGLSATEVKDKMKETGDMTKAVGAIIREQMAKAGDYVETAADRAAQANVSLQNKMEELGRKFAPVEEASSQLWTSMKIGILDIVGGPLARLLNGLTEAGRLKNMLNDMNGEPGSGNTKVDRQVKKLNVIKKAGGSDYIFNSTLNGMLEDYNRQIAALDAKIKDTKKLSPDQQASKFVRDEVQKMNEQMKALGMMRDQLAEGAKELLKPVASEATNAVVAATTGSTTKGGTTKTPQTELQQNQTKINELTQQYVALMAAASKAGKPLTDEQQKQTSEIQRQIAELEKRNGQLKLFDERAHGRLLPVDTSRVAEIAKDGITGNPFLADNQAMEFTGSLKLQLDEKAMDAVDKQIKKQTKGMKGGWEDAAGAIQAVGSAMSQIEDPAAKVVGTVAQAIASIALGYAQATIKAQETGGPWAWIAFAAAGLATMISTISAIHSATGYAQGGMIKGNSYSGDNIGGMVDGGAGGFVGLNAGEVVLNRAQTGNLASQLQGSGFGNSRLVGRLKGRDIIISIDRELSATGRGQMATWK